MHFRTTMQQSHTVWNTIAYLRRRNVTFIEPDMWPPSSPDLNLVNYTIWVVLHFLLYAVYICQKSLNFTYAFKCYQQNCSWLHFTWPTLHLLNTGIHVWTSCLAKGRRMTVERLGIGPVVSPMPCYDSTPVDYNIQFKTKKSVNWMKSARWFVNTVSFISNMRLI